MENKETITATAQPELYKCDCCQNYSTTHREWPYRLCRHCYYNWMEGRMSTKELIMLCNWNLDNVKKLRNAVIAANY